MLLLFFYLQVVKKKISPLYIIYICTPTFVLVASSSPKE